MGDAKVVLATVTNADAMSATLGGLGVNGKLIILGAAAEPLQVAAIPLILGRRSILGWPSGSSIDSQDTLTFSLLTGGRAMTEAFPLGARPKPYEHMMSGKARFRAVLTMTNTEASHRVDGVGEDRVPATPDQSNYGDRLFEETSPAIYLISGGELFVLAGLLLLLVSGVQASAARFRRVAMRCKRISRSCSRLLGERGPGRPNP